MKTHKLASLLAVLLGLIAFAPSALGQMVPGQSRTVLSARTTNGSSDPVRVTAGSYQFFAWKTWAGATVQGEFSIDCSTNWTEIDTWYGTENGGGGPQDLMTGCVRDRERRRHVLAQLHHPRDAVR